MLKNNDYIILANRVSGNLDEYEKNFLLSGVAGILGCERKGFETADKGDFMICAEELKRNYKCVVVAGGDGTFSDVLNAGDNNGCVLAYLPLGTGNAVGSAFGYEMSEFNDLSRIAERIVNGEDHAIDLIKCEASYKSCKGLMCGVGIDADVIKRSNIYRSEDKNSLEAYVRASVDAVFGKYDSFNLNDRFIRDTVTVDVDGEVEIFSNLITYVITKHPFFGYGLMVNPTAKMDSGFLHGVAVTGGIPTIAKALLTSANKGTIFGGNMAGKVHCADEIRIFPTRDLPLQVDGNLFAEGKEFYFKVLKGDVKVRY